MTHRILALVACCCCLTFAAVADDDVEPLKRALTFHASFDKGLEADLSADDKACFTKQGKQLVPCVLNDDVKLAPVAGKFGAALHFPRKGATRPQFKASRSLNYNDKSWSATLSLWLRISPDEDLEPGYCDALQVVGDDMKKGFIFLEWSKDEKPRYFRYAIRPLFEIWNPTNVQWADIPFDKRPMVQLSNAPFSRDRWTHVVCTLSNLNDKSAKPSGTLYLDGKPQGRIDNWDLRFAWNPAQVSIILGAAYVGYIDDVALFNQALTDAQVQRLHTLETGIASLK